MAELRHLDGLKHGEVRLRYIYVLPETRHEPSWELFFGSNVIIHVGIKDVKEETIIFSWSEDIAVSVWERKALI